MPDTARQNVRKTDVENSVKVMLKVDKIVLETFLKIY